MSNGTTTSFHSSGFQTRAARRASLLFVGESCTVGVALRAGETLVVGRSSPADVVLEERSLSRGHARLTWEENALRVEDLGSTNGTFVDGERITHASVEPGSTLRLGGVEARLHVSRFAPSPDASDSEALDSALASELRRGEVFGRSTAVLALRDPTGERDLANVLRSSLRPTDRCVPYAATIALVMLAEVELGGVLAWVDRLRSVAHPTPLVVGASVGPVCGDDPHTLVQGALTALRRATLREVAFAPSKRPRTTPRTGDSVADDVVVESPPMRALHATLDRVARTKLPVLVLGETGAGKEHVAKALHERGHRSSGPFRAVNCAALPSSLLESTLFGHEKGAFTGATERAAGLFEQADGGTVFLDEVGELPLPAQAALLRVLETKKLVRVGGTKELEVDVRVVAATHRDLEGMVEAGTFRADLLYRLDALTLEVPPLRERVEDVAPLAR
ncbi:MAG: sigma 54-interacting transcriptional regulator, partial [Sandaracinus sp.]|nr:sigma 54-interacting transcriptional regulator [Sandaracinus sp.]